MDWCKWRKRERTKGWTSTQKGWRMQDRKRPAHRAASTHAEHTNRGRHVSAQLFVESAENRFQFVGKIHTRPLRWTYHFRRQISEGRNDTNGCQDRGRERQIECFGAKIRAIGIFLEGDSNEFANKPKVDPHQHPLAHNFILLVSPVAFRASPRLECDVGIVHVFPRRTCCVCGTST